MTYFDSLDHDTEIKVRRFMFANAELCLDRRTMSIDSTWLAELAAKEFNLYVDDYAIHDEVFGIACEVAAKAAAQLRVVW